MLLKGGLVFLVVLFVIQSAMAQPVDCRIEGFKDFVLLDKDDSVRLSFLKIIDKEYFKESRRGVATGGDVIVEGIPISGYGNYDEFDQARSREFEKYQFDYASDSALSYVTQFLSPTGLQAYLACVDRNAQSTSGVHVWAKSITSEKVSISVLWNPPVGAAIKGKAIVQMSGADNGILSHPLFKTEWGVNETRTIDITRFADQEFRFTINMNGYSNSVVVALPPIQRTITCQPQKIESRFETYFSDYPPNTPGANTSLGVSVGGGSAFGYDKAHIIIDEACAVSIRYVVGARASNLRYPDRNSAPWVWIQLFNAGGSPLLSDYTNTESLASVSQCGGAEEHIKPLTFISHEVASKVASFDIKVGGVSAVQCP